MERSQPDRHTTKTRSVAWNLGDGRPVVMVDGVTGGVALSHLEVLAQAPMEGQQ
jgi:hypothetical protein